MKAETKPGNLEKPVEAIAKPGQRTADTPSKNQLTNSLGMQFVLIPAGEFMMGSPADDKDARDEEKPQHRVRISRPFYLGVYEVTQAEYAQVMGVNPSSFSANGKDAGKVSGQDTSRHPVETVSWNDAVQSCQKLSTLPKERAARRMYRLPTEAEWEYAARAGSTTRWYFGDDPAGQGEHAWFVNNSGGMTHPVGQKKPNAWGLHDMVGNVWEWCMDRYGQDYYRQSPPIDPTGPPADRYRVLRGGSFNNPYRSRSAFRYRNSPASRTNDQGFRLVLVR